MVIARVQRVPLPRFRSLRSRILFFAIVAALVPAGAILWLSYTQNRRARAEKITQELRSESAQTARAMGVWLKERLYDLRVFANSNEVSGQLTTGGAGGTRLTDYLTSLQVRFGDFSRLAVVDLQGRVVASSTRDASPVKLAADWSRLLRSEGQAVGEPAWNETKHTGTITVAVPVKRFDGRLIGAFTADVNLVPLKDVLHAFVSDTAAGAVFLITSEGINLASSRDASAQLTARTIDARALKRLEARERDGYEYRSADGGDVIGTLTPVPQVHWSVVAEMSSKVAFDELRRYGRTALIVVIILGLVVAATGYRLGFLMARPLDRLTQAAVAVSTGDFAVDLPEGAAGEIGQLTAVFNDMVYRLRDARKNLDTINETLRERNEELERLSVTDVLTGLSNRRNLMQRLSEEIVRSNRTTQPFAVVMADVDNFKQYNDKYGHPAGDAVLREVAALLRKSARGSDCVARYGGEEFCLILPVTGPAEAAQLAERIRARVEKNEFTGGSITLSLGVASVPEDGKTPEEALEAADEALYQAKRDGRNRVVRK